MVNVKLKESMPSMSPELKLTGTTTICALKSLSMHNKFSEFGDLNVVVHDEL